MVLSTWLQDKEKEEGDRRLSASLQTEMPNCKRSEAKARGRLAQKRQQEMMQQKWSHNRRQIDSLL